MAYLKNLFIAFDQLLNAILNGWADETLSSRAWRTGNHALIDTLLFFDKDHCYNAYLSEKKRKQLPPEFR